MTRGSARLGPQAAVEAAQHGLIGQGHVDPVVALLTPTATHYAGEKDERFEIGSITKVFTSLLLAVLAADDAVRLDDTVARWVPDVATLAPRVGDITLASLASHRSGLPRLPPGAVRESLRPGGTRDPYARIDETALLDALARVRLRGKPGQARVRYSNLGGGLLGYLLGRADGGGYENALARHVLSPLGLSATDFSDEPLHQGRYRTKPAGPWHLAALAGAGGLRSSALDLLCWLAAELDPPAGFANAMAAMRRPRGRMGPASVGLGWFMHGDPPVLRHDGGTLGARTEVRLDTGSRVGVVVLGDNRRGTASAADTVLRQSTHPP